MKDVLELLRAKEQELLKLKRQVEALKIAAPLLGSDDDAIFASTKNALPKGPERLS
jgi:hypothetical protein